jgi:hypothetical protein
MTIIIKCVRDLFQKRRLTRQRFTLHFKRQIFIKSDVVKCPDAVYLKICSNDFARNSLPFIQVWPPGTINVSSLRPFC